METKRLYTQQIKNDGFEYEQRKIMSVEVGRCSVIKREWHSNVLEDKQNKQMRLPKPAGSNANSAKAT